MILYMYIRAILSCASLDSTETRPCVSYTAMSGRSVEVEKELKESISTSITDDTDSIKEFTFDNN